MKYITLSDEQYKWLCGEIDNYYETYDINEEKNLRNKAEWAARVSAVMDFILIDDDSLYSHVFASEENYEEEEEGSTSS